MEGFHTVLAQGRGEGLIYFILIVAFFIGFVFLMRLLGAWMLRINEVIDLLKSIRSLLKKSLENTNDEKDSSSV